MSIGEIILKNKNIESIDAVEIGLNDATRVVADFDVDTALRKYTGKQIVDAYVEKGILKMICFA